MDFPDINLIKKKRQQTGLKQKELAKLSGVSQSLIAKLEAGTIEASYTKIKNIFDTLQKHDSKDEKTCSDVMTSKIIYLSPGSTLKAVVIKMKKYGISQIPIIEKNNVVGTITESIILDHVDKDLQKIKVQEVMGDPLPIVSHNTKTSSVRELVKEYGAVIIRKDKITGLISKADLI